MLRKSSIWPDLHGISTTSNLYMLGILKLLVRLGNMKLLAPSLSQHPSTRLTSLSERLII